MSIPFPPYSTTEGTEGRNVTGGAEQRRRAERLDRRSCCKCVLCCTLFLRSSRLDTVPSALSVPACRREDAWTRSSDQPRRHAQRPFQAEGACSTTSGIRVIRTPSHDTSNQ